jgi:uncharacterized protein (TIGR02118 family)
VVKVSVFYANGPDSHFDMDYYCAKHIPMVQRLCGSALRAVAVEKGLAGGTPGAAPSFLAMGHLHFQSVESFQAAFGPHMQEIMADVPNYTNIQPSLQISQIMM